MQLMGLSTELISVEVLEHFAVTLSPLIRQK